MAKPRRSLTDFNTFETKQLEDEVKITSSNESASGEINIVKETVQSDDEVKINNDTEDSNHSVTLNKDTEQYSETFVILSGEEDVTEKVNTITEKKQTSVRRKTVSNNEHSLVREFSNKKRPTVEDTHTRQTYLIRNDLLEIMDKLAEKQDRGFKTHLVNYAIERVINEITAPTKHK